MKNAFLLLGLTSITLACSTVQSADPRGIKTGPLTSSDIAALSMRSIKVYVVADADSEDPSVDEEPIHRKRNDNQPIRFELMSAGYKFPANAVTFDDVRTSPPPDEMECATTTNGHKAFREVVCKNRHRTSGTYKYTLRVTNAATGNVLTLDPFIVNH